MSVIRPGTVIWFCAVVAVGYAMFQVKYEVMQQEQTLAGLNKQIADGREQIRVLDAEWSYLTRPSRIEQLAGRFLHLSTMSSAQIVDLAAVPERADPTATTHAADPTPRTSPRIAAVIGKHAP
ncbi:MAG TPA: hypothetical protein VGP48_00275 [Stellaceae bacterium]|jgi:hypothetical protein|nr:hypothetical protein [Stellaceae bacterium]